MFPVAKKLTVTSALTRAGIQPLSFVSVRWITGATKFNKDSELSGVKRRHSVYS